MSEHANKNPLGVSAQLPFDVRMALVRAAATPTTPGGRNEKLKAIELVVSRARITHPYLFGA